MIFTILLARLWLRRLTIGDRRCGISWRTIVTDKASSAQFLAEIGPSQIRPQLKCTYRRSVQRGWSWPRDHSLHPYG